MNEHIANLEALQKELDRLYRTDPIKNMYLANLLEAQLYTYRLILNLQRIEAERQ